MNNEINKELLEACKGICAAVADCLPISGNTNKLDVLYYKSKLMAIDQAAAVCSQAILKAESPITDADYAKLTPLQLDELADDQ